MLITTFAFAQNKEFILESVYYSSEVENPSIAKEIAFVKGKRKIIVEALPYINRLLKDNKTYLTKEQLQVLAYYFAEFDYISQEEKITNKITAYVVKLRMIVTPEKILESAIKMTGESVSSVYSDHNEIIAQMEKHEKKLDILKEKLNGMPASKEVIKGKITNLQNIFHGLIFYDKGFGYFINGECGLAIKELTKSIEANPSHVKAYSYRAKSYQLAGDIEAAIKDYRKIISIDPTYERAYYNLGTILLGNEEVDIGIANLSKAIMLNSNFPEAYNNRGAGYLRKEQYKLAVEDFTKSISLNSKDPNTYHNRAFAEYKRGNFESAIKDADKVIKLSPNYAEAYFIRGLSYIGLLDVDNGMPDVVKACKMNFNDACKFTESNKLDKIEFKKAWTFYLKHEISNALEILKKIDKPDDERTILLHSLIYLEQDKPQEALNAISNIRDKIEKAYSLIADESAKTNLSEEDVQDIKDNYHYMLYASGSAYYKLNNCNNAIKDLEMFTIKYENVTASDTLGICYALEKEYAMSIKYFKQGFNILEKQEKRNSGAYNAEAYNIASVYALMHNVEESIHWAKIPLEHDRKLWLEKIQTDSDFEHIRNNRKFKDFISENERLLMK